MTTDIAAQSDNAVEEARVAAVQAEHVSYEPKLQESCELHPTPSSGAALHTKASAEVFLKKHPGTRTIWSDGRLELFDNSAPAVRTGDMPGVWTSSVTHFSVC